jgi:hypothetical protein
MATRSTRLSGAAFTAFVAAAILSACGSTSNKTTADAGTTTTGVDAGIDAAIPPAGVDAMCPVVVKDSDCDKNQRPFVFVHGTYGSGANFGAVAMLLGSNGFCQDRIVGVEYNSVVGTNTDTLIDSVIDKVLADPKNVDASGHPFTQVDIAGHSQGTSHCGTYLNGSAAHAAKVAHYFNFSGVPNIGTVPTLSISSMHDLGGRPNHATGASVCTSGPGEAPVPAGCNVVQVTFTDQDHFACAASRDSFVAVYTYLKGKAPQYTSVQCGDVVTVSGISETFADNVPVTGKIVLTELGDTPRMPGLQVNMDPPDASGNFGPIQLKRNVAYEFAGYDTNGKLVGYSYFTPFKRSNRLVRLLTPSTNALVASQTTDKIVRGPNHSAIVALWAGGGFRQDLGASMKVNGMEVLTDQNAGATALGSANLAGGVVGFFMYDANMNMMSDLGLVTSSSFIAYTDVFMDATTPGFINLALTAGSEDPAYVGVTAKIPNWPSKDALMSVTFQ